MPIGAYRNLHTALFKTDEYLELEAGPSLLWLNLIGNDNTPRCGIIKISYHLFRDYSKNLLDNAGIDDALAQFEQHGWLKRDGDFIWIINFIKIQGNSSFWTKGALKQAQALARYTNLATECLEYYAEDEDEGTAEAPPERRPASPEPHTQTSQTDQSDLFDADAPVPPPAKPKKRKPEKPRSYSDEDLALASELEQIILGLESEDLKIISPRTPAAMAAGIAKSDLTHEQIRKVFAWAQDDPYQQATLVKMARWTTPTAYRDLWNKYRQQQDIKRAEDGDDDEEQAPTTQAFTPKPPPQQDDSRPPASNKIANRIYDTLAEDPDSGMTKAGLEVSLDTARGGLDEVLGMMVRKGWIVQDGKRYRLRAPP